MTLAGTPLVPHTKVRLGLLLYSHLTEVAAMYDMLANFTRVVAGERYVIDPFSTITRATVEASLSFSLRPAKSARCARCLRASATGHSSRPSTGSFIHRCETP